METDRPPLNPPQTPQCREYNELYRKWANLAKNGESWMDAYNAMSEHRASCPVCQARIAELTELARNAKEPELDDEQQKIETAA